MSWLEAVVLAVVQGLTEFLPVSSSAHLRIVSAVFWDNDAGASFTAVTQLGTETAVLVYFAKDIFRIIASWCKGLVNPAERNLDYRIGWSVIIATIPIGVLGLLLSDVIESTFRNLWITGTTLIVFALVIALAEKVATQARPIEQFTMRDGIVMGLAQCLALIPGVSRSGATSSAGLFIGLTRETAVRFSFLLAIPAVTASGLYQLAKVIKGDPEGKTGQVLAHATGPQLAVATLIAFVLGYAVIAWLLKFVIDHSLNWFVGYRIALGLGVFVLLGAGVVQAA
ncbi:MAG: undecaprenyl-diphosphate phosphatase [Nocardiaceae bacterium]|nr:undecaprenyl-diphosphate phosphatase [Nocardiaceae bacterium]